MSEPDRSVELAKRFIVAAIALISTMLGAYFIWLGTEINYLGKEQAAANVKIDRIEASVRSLLDTRERTDGRRDQQIEQNHDDNAANISANANRIGELESEGSPQP